CRSAFRGSACLVAPPAGSGLVWCAAMPELRRDPVVGRWVIVAPERADRPHALLRSEPDPDDEDGCPFCPGNEPMTPPELLVRRAQGSQPNRPGWTLRVVPNRFPALRTEERMTRSATGLYDSMAGVGAHEVIIETAEHGRALPQQTAAEVQELLRAAQERMLDLSRDVRLRSALFFKNSGWAARSTFEVWVLPREHRSNFEQSSPAELAGLAQAIRLALRKLDLALERPAYNFYLHTLPLREPAAEWYHWHVEVKPVLTLQGGFEWGSGFFINPTPPEEAAAFLRQTEA